MQTTTKTTRAVRAADTAAGVMRCEALGGQGSADLARGRAGPEGAGDRRAELAQRELETGERDFRFH